MAALLPITCWSLAHLDDAFHLGVLSSRIHVTYALAAGGWLGVGNDPVYSKTRCFDPFPFPLCGEAEKARIREIAEQLDAHRKRVQAQHSHLTLTGMYNVLEKLRAADAARYSPLPEGAEPLAGGAASLSERNHRSHAERDPAQTRNTAASMTPQQRPRKASPAKLW